MIPILETLLELSSTVVQYERGIHKVHKGVYQISKILITKSYVVNLSIKGKVVKNPQNPVKCPRSLWMPKEDSSFYLKYQLVRKMCQQVTFNDNRLHGAVGQIKRWFKTDRFWEKFVGTDIILWYLILRVTLI